MNRTNPGAGQHGIGSFRNHRHVNADPVTLADPLCLHRIGKPADMFMQLAIGDLRVVFRVIAFPDDRGLVATGFQMPVDAVNTGVQRTVFIPFDGDRCVEVHITDFRIRFDPVDTLALFSPEAVRVFHGLLVHRVIFRAVNQGIGGNFGFYGY